MLARITGHHRLPFASEEVSNELFAAETAYETVRRTTRLTIEELFTESVRLSAHACQRANLHDQRRTSARTLSACRSPFEFGGQSLQMRASVQLRNKTNNDRSVRTEGGVVGTLHFDSTFCMAVRQFSE